MGSRARAALHRAKLSKCREPHHRGSKDKRSDSRRLLTRQRCLMVACAHVLLWWSRMLPPVASLPSPAPRRAGLGRPCSSGGGRGSGRERRARVPSVDDGRA